jgi:hypothetical protein
MAEQPRKRPRPPPDDDDLKQPYRLQDDEAARVAPRPRPVRRSDDDEEDLRPRRPRRVRSRPAPSVSPDTWVKLAVGGVVVLVVLIGLCAFGGWFLYRNMQTAPFRGAMSAYLAAPAGAVPNGTAHASGKMVVVDTTKKDVDWDIFFALPDNVRASSPQEVGTIVQLTWAKIHSPPDYDNGAPAYVQNCHVLVIDAKTKQQLFEQFLQGTEPPSSIDSTQSEGCGSKPTDQVLNFLKGLPRQ